MKNRYCHLDRPSVLTRLLNEVKTFLPDLYNIFITQDILLEPVSSFSFAFNNTSIVSHIETCKHSSCIRLYCSKLPHSRHTRYKVPFISQ